MYLLRVLCCVSKSQPICAPKERKVQANAVKEGAQVNVLSGACLLTGVRRRPSRWKASPQHTELS